MTGGRCAQCEHYLDRRPGVIVLVELSPAFAEPPPPTLLCSHGCLASWTLDRLRELDDAREGRLPGLPPP